MGLLHGAIAEGILEHTGVFRRYSKAVLDEWSFQVNGWASNTIRKMPKEVRKSQGFNLGRGVVAKCSLSI